MTTERIDEGMSKSMGGTYPNVHMGNVVDGTKGSLGNIIGPARTLKDTIGADADTTINGLYILTKDQLALFESKIGPDILPETGSVIMIGEVIGRENCTVEIIPQGLVDNVMETKGSRDLYRYYSVEHPTGFTTGFGSDMEEM